MQYNYRWFYAFGISITIMLVGFFWQIQPIITNINLLQMQKENLLVKLSNYKKVILQQDKKIFIANKEVILKKLFGLLHVNNLQLSTFSFIDDATSQATNRKMLRLIMVGDFAQLTHFVSALAIQIKSVIVTHFEFKLRDDEKIKSKIELLLLNNDDLHFLGQNIYFHELKLNVDNNNPFCHAESEQSIPADTTLTPLAQMKMVGFLQEGEQKQALLLLPNDELVIVTTRMYIGREHAFIADITANKVLLVLANKKQMELEI